MHDMAGSKTKGMTYLFAFIVIAVELLCTPAFAIQRGSVAKSDNADSNNNVSAPKPAFNAKRSRISDPLGDPNQLFNFSGDEPSVETTITSGDYNQIFGGSCTVNEPSYSLPPCNPTDGMFSYQFNAYFPLFSNSNLRFWQDVVEFDLNTGSCYAQTGTINPYTFNCDSADTEGEYFSWVWYFNAQQNYFLQTEFFLNGQEVYEATSQQMFGCSACAFLQDTYGESVWVGWGETTNQNGAYANFYSGQGQMVYNGLSSFVYGPGGTGVTFTYETSNIQYTIPTLSSGTYTQNYVLGSLGYSYVASGSGTWGHGTLSDPNYILGAPDGLYTQLYGGNQGDGAYIEVELQPGYNSYNGTLVIDGYSYNNGVNAYYSPVTVNVSTDGVHWSEAYAGTWDPSSSNSPAWTYIGRSVSDVNYVRIGAKDTLDSADVYIDAISLYCGSYVQTLYGSGTLGNGVVTNPNGILGVPDNNLAEIYGGHVGDGGYIEGEFNWQSSIGGGWLIFDGYSYNNNNGAYISRVYIFTSTDGTDWTQQNATTLEPSQTNTAVWQSSFAIYLGAQTNSVYVKIEAYDGQYSANLYIDAIYLS
jgi:hypothetical protein